MRRVLLVLVAATLTACGGGDPAPTAEESAADASRLSEAMKPSGVDDVSVVNTAYKRCIDAITAQLKAPATASFSARSAENEARKGGSFYFSGAVDSENGFGALLRSQWGCQIDYDLATNSYTTVIADID